MRDPAPIVRLLDASKTPYSYIVLVQFSNYLMMFAGRGEIYLRIDEMLRDAGIAIAAEIHEVRYHSVEASSKEAFGPETRRGGDRPRDESQDFG